MLLEYEYVDLCDYTIVVNRDSTDLGIVRSVLCGNDYHKYIHPEPDDVWLDAGAHVGAFSLRYADEVASILAYEPSVQNVQLLTLNLERYHRHNVIVRNLALVGDDSVSRVFSVSNGKDRSSGSILPYKRRRETYPVRCENITDVIDQYGVNKVKMDIEGAEFECIMSMSLTTLSLLDELVVEYHFSMLGEIGDGENFHNMVAHLRSAFRTVVAVDDVKKRWNTIVYGSNL